MVALWFLIAFLFAAIAAPSETVGEAKKITNEQATAALDKQERLETVKVQIADLMMMAAVGDAFAEEVADKFRNNTLTVSVTPDGDMVAHFKGGAPGKSVESLTSFAIVGPAEVGSLAVGPPPRGFLYRDVEGMFVYAMTDLWAPWYLGVAALQQAVRWDNLESGRVPNADPRSPEWLESELQAQRVAIAAVDRHTSGALSRTVQDKIREQGLELPLEAMNFPKLSKEELDGMVGLAFSGDIAMNRDEAAHRAAPVLAAYYLTISVNTPEAQRNALRWSRAQLRS